MEPYLFRRHDYQEERAEKEAEAQLRRRQELPEPGAYRNEHPGAEEPGHDGESRDLPHEDGPLHRVELVHMVCVLQLLDDECHHQQAGQLH